MNVLEVLIALCVTVILSKPPTKFKIKTHRELEPFLDVDLTFFQSFKFF